MKRWIIYAAALAMLGISPLQGMDIGQLSPVETVWLTEQDGQVYIQTDGGDFGRGTDVPEALEQMNDSASRIIFLETADYLIIEEGKEELLEQVFKVLRPTCMICKAEQMPDLRAATSYLRVHEPELTLRQWRIERSTLPQLQERDGRFVWHV